MIHEGYPDKNFENPKIDFYCNSKIQFFGNVPKISQNITLGANFFGIRIQNLATTPKLFLEMSILGRWTKMSPIIGTNGLPSNTTSRSGAARDAKF